MKESKEAIIEERDEQLRIMEGVLQAKETIIDQLQTDVEYYKSEMHRFKRDAEWAKEDRNEKVAKYKKLLNNKKGTIYIDTQWGNNIIVTSGYTKIVTNTQWGTNIVIPAWFLPFKWVISKILSAFLDETNAKKYGWEKINFRKDGKND